MIATWWAGDVLKTAYFIVKEAPVQFFVCGLIQLALDTVLAGQLMLYRRRDSGSVAATDLPSGAVSIAVPADAYVLRAVKTVASAASAAAASATKDG